MEYVTFRNKIYKVKNGALSLKDKGIDDIAEIGGLTEISGLRLLDLSYNNITEIKDLENFRDLISLDLSNNKITQIKGLETLQNLRFLKLSNNYLREIEGLETLTNLMTLYLDKNSIFEIKGLDNLKRLNALYLAGNRITEVKGVNSLPNLKLFDLGTKPLIPKEQVKRIKASGVQVKKQNYFKNRFLKRFIWYCVGIAIADLIITPIIAAAFHLTFLTSLPIFFGIYGLLFIFSPLLYVIGRAYAGV